MALGGPNGRSSRRQTRAARAGASDVAARYGFHRVEHVHILVGNGFAEATVTGICHRYPRAVRVPLRVAARLVAAGAPLTVERGDIVPGTAAV